MNHDRQTPGTIGMKEHRIPGWITSQRFIALMRAAFRSAAPVPTTIQAWLSTSGGVSATKPKQAARNSDGGANREHAHVET